MAFPLAEAQRPKHLVVFGATGFTARVTLAELVKGPSTRWPAGFTWAIAGRSRPALESLRTSLYKDNVHPAVPLPDVIVADVRDEVSLTAMTHQTQLLLNCVGPYREYGEPVVKACIDAGTDYLDLCGEPGFIERMHLVYHDAAVKAGITIVHAAAFDSIPCDLGVLLCKKLLADRGAYPSSVEMFFSLKTPTSLYKHMNYATYESAIKGFASIATLREGRKELARVRPKPSPVGPTVTPQRANWLLGHLGVTRDPRLDGWFVPYFFSDPAIVRLTQVLTLHMMKFSGTPPAELASVHFMAYIRIQKLRYLIMFLVLMQVFQFLVVYAWGRSLLYKYPALFTGGLAARNVDPDYKTRQDVSFTQTFYARGYSSALHPTPVNTPDISLAVRIAGPEPGYSATSVIFLEAANVLLRRRDAVSKGVLTPAVAFGSLETFKQTTAPGEGGVMDALQRDGRVTWSVIQS